MDLIFREPTTQHVNRPEFIPSKHAVVHMLVNILEGMMRLVKVHLR